MSRCLLTWALLAAAVRAESVELTPTKDNTIIQWSPDTSGTNPYLSNGKGDIFVGRTNQDGQEEATISIRRGLVQFDLAAAIPAGATITGATLTMRDVRGLNGDPVVSLHRVIQNWGEGSSFFNGGQGIAATDGDVTWLHTVYNAMIPAASPTWTTRGGDFISMESASSVVTDDMGGGQLFSWSEPGMVADVQYWLAHPSDNFGWLLRGDEAHGQTAKRLNSRESTSTPNVPPKLSIEFTTMLAGDYNGNGTVDAADYTVWRDHLGAGITLPNETATLGSVTVEDYNVWKTQFGAGGSGAADLVSAPEPSGKLLAFSALVVFAALVPPRSWAGGSKGLT